MAMPVRVAPPATVREPHAVLAAAIADVNVFHSAVIGGVASGPTLQHGVDARRVTLHVDGSAAGVLADDARACDERMSHGGNHARSAGRDDLLYLAGEHRHDAVERLTPRGNTRDDSGLHGLRRVHAGDQDATAVARGRVPDALHSAGFRARRIRLDCDAERHCALDAGPARRSVNSFTRHGDVALRMHGVRLTLAGLGSGKKNKQKRHRKNDALHGDTPILLDRFAATRGSASGCGHVGWIVHSRRHGRA